MLPVLILLLAAFWSSPPEDPESEVLQFVKERISHHDEINFAEFYNDSRWSAVQKEYLGRLYETFFQIPPVLRSEYMSLQRLPSEAELAATFGVSRQSIRILLDVMASDPRIPPLFTRDGETHELLSLNLENIDGFVDAFGGQVRVTRWESKPLPVFRLDRFDEGVLSNEDLREKPSFIYFWFTGCPPCERAAPIVAKLHERFAERVAFVGFNADRALRLNISDQSRREHLRKHNIKFPNLYLDRKARAAFGGLVAFPAFFLVRSDGIIARHLISYQDERTLEDQIKALLHPSNRSQ
ncbi:MAG: redoxin family protein [Acidobacteria bacterium]|nr:redoxin family protein [Acidobacteriota bacterium]